MILNVKVFPNSGKQEIVKVSDREYKIFLKSLPEHNKANIELIKLLKKRFGNAKIIRGFKSRNKFVEIK